MNGIVIELQLLPDQYNQLTALAKERQLPLGELAQVVVAEWLEYQTQLEYARALMRQLGQGLAEGQGQRDTARNHDAYLYSRTSV